MMKILYTLGLFGLLTLSACSDAEPIVDEEPDFNNDISDSIKKSSKRHH